MPRDSLAPQPPRPPASAELTYCCVLDPTPVLPARLEDVVSLLPQIHANCSHIFTAIWHSSYTHLFNPPYPDVLNLHLNQWFSVTMPLLSRGDFESLWGHLSFLG